MAFDPSALIGLAGLLPGPQHLLGGLGDMWNRQMAEKEAAAERARQYEFAKHGLQWRMEDAKAAGIHPLAALGFQGPTPSPVTVGTENGPGNWAKELGRDMGQATNRAAEIAMNQVQREELSAINFLNLERAKLQNENLRLQNLQLANQVSPPMPQIDSVEKTVSSDIGYVKTDDGGYAIVPSEQVKERIEDSPYEYLHMLRNLYVNEGPKITPDQRDPKARLEPGKRWQWNPTNQKYYQVQITDPNLLRRNLENQRNLFFKGFAPRWVK